MWIVIIFVFLAVLVLSLLRINSKLRLFMNQKKSLLTLLLASVLLSVFLGTVNAMIVMIHLVLFILIADGILLAIKRTAKKEFSRKVAFVFSAAAAAVYLSFAFYNALHVSRTEYRFKNQKNDGKLKIVQITDSHIGATFSSEGFKRHVERINSENADLVVVTGDFVDESTSKKDMEECCKILGSVNSRLGVYFVFGNHDEGYNRKSRGYGLEEILQNLKENDVKVLQDQSVVVDGNFLLVGRKDRSEVQRKRNRKSMKELMADADEKLYTIVLDHQPCDYKNQAEEKVDLVISGHTHGGQFFPLNRLGEWIGVNDATYGLKKMGQSSFVVSSGISDWALKFKTGCKSEYVVINIGCN